MYEVSWNEFESLALDLAKKIDVSSMNFDAIVCVSRGGLLLGRILSSALDLPLGVISAKNIDGKYFVDNSISFLYDIEGSILLVDDVFEETSKIIVNLLNKNYNKIEKICLASIFYKSKNIFKPDFFISEIKHSLDIVFPYQENVIFSRYKYKE
ncbi:MAG: phosphoribosyltransferase family protein [Candidatus ainarchaeum sp.]|nr:phosphoribosyltransferase family protein [Candidatus ainarchaeum sp.]MDD3975975.1 phosphoribosyltransferase family protein [Candidatus ainarchaeum sp.]